MHEAEVKILDIDRTAVEERIRELGGSKVFDASIHAIYYDAPDGAVQRQRGTFRLRKEGDRSVLAYKRHVTDTGAKVREETEVDVSDFDAMRAIIEALGFRPWLEMVKHRTTYALGAVQVEFDAYGGEHAFIPEFIEIEGPDAETVISHAALLGFPAVACLPWDAVQLAEHYAHRRRI